MRMRTITILVLVAAALWSAWWVAGWQATRTALARGQAEALARGWTAAWSDASVSGYPNRFDTRLTDVVLADPNAHLVVTAPRLDAMMLSYRPNRAIVAFPPEMGVEVYGLPVVVRSERMRASVVVEPALPPALDRATLVGEGLLLEALGGALGVARAQVATRQAGGRDRHDVAVDLVEIAVPAPLVTLLAPGGLPPVMEEARVDASVTFDGPLDATAGRDLRVRDVELRRANLLWGDVALVASGDLRADEAGLLSGALEVRARGWRRLLDVAEAQRLLPQGQRPLIEAALGGLAGEDGAVEAALSVVNGAVRLGPFTVGRLPRLR